MYDKTNVIITCEIKLKTMYDKTNDIAIAAKRHTRTAIKTTSYIIQKDI
jgi:hypothetical protein